MFGKTQIMEKRRMLVLFMVLLLIGGSIWAAPLPFQNEDETARRLWDEGFLKKRPAGKRAAQRRQAYRRVSTQSPSSIISATAGDAIGEALIGITLWRLRPSTAADDKGVRILIQEEESPKSTEW